MHVHPVWNTPFILYITKLNLRRQVSQQSVGLALPHLHPAGHGGREQRTVAHGSIATHIPVQERRQWSDFRQNLLHRQMKCLRPPPPQHTYTHTHTHTHTSAIMHILYNQHCLGRTIASGILLCACFDNRPWPHLVPSKERGRSVHLDNWLVEVQWTIQRYNLRSSWVGTLQSDG